MEDSRANRRRQPRLRRKLPVALDLRGRPFGAITSNLSSTGLLLHSSQMLLAGSAVSGTLILDNVEVRFTALVRWSRAASRASGADGQNSIGLEFLEAPSRAYSDFLKRALGEQEEQPRTKIELPLPPPRAPSRSFSSANAVLDDEDMMPTAVSLSVPPIDSLPPFSERSGVKTGRTNISEELAVQERTTAEISLSAYAARTEAPTAETRIVPRFGLLPGLSGKAEGSTRSTLKSRGTSPLAISAAATLFERAAVQAVASALPPGAQTVAVSMDLKLVLPAQVTLGGKLEALATLVEVAADRILRFEVELREGTRLVARGEHKRLIS